MGRALGGSVAAALALALFTAVGAQAPSGATADVPFDVLLRGGEVLDGTGNPRFRADVGIRGGRVAWVGDLSAASGRREVDAEGLVVAPGFIDIHSHASLGADDPWTRAAPSLVAQGVTTVVINQDGRSPWPIADQVAELREKGHGPNAVVLVGHGEVRRRAMDGDVERPMTQAEEERLRELVRQGLDEGAWGFSAALEYNPGRWATTDEVVAVAEEVAARDGIFVSHQRSEGPDPMWYWPSQDEPGPPDLVDAVLETIEVAERTGVRAVASHLKAKGAHYWGASHTVARLIGEARDRGVPIYGDQYYYETTGSDGNTRLIPGWAVGRGRELLGAEGDEEAEPGDAVEALLAHETLSADLRRDVAHEIRRRGGPDRLFVLEHPDDDLVGMTVAELVEAWELPPVDVALRLQLEGDRSTRGGARLRGYSLHEMDIEAYAPYDWMMTASDAGIGRGEGGLVHPRFYGTFPRRIARYARDLELTTVPHAVRSATSLPAQVLGMRDRGTVREGVHADLVVFDLDEIQDRATLFEPHQYPDGIPYVLVGGEFVVDGGEVTGALPGRVLTPADADDPGSDLVSPTGEVAWDRYHTNAEAIGIMRAFEELYPGLARVFSIGESREGRELMVAEITNRETGPAHEKPALYLDGGIHAQELTASQVALYVMAHLLNGYGDDPQVTELLDTRAFYIRPKFNPDGSDLVLEEDQWLRSTPRPVDENGDGIPDSDPPEDLDGDGRILQMLVPDADGRLVRDPDDPRIVRSREEEDEGPFYRQAREGRDLNGDGTLNSDGIGGMDMNRNFPYNWAPLHRQPGSYNFPLSEPETWAAANFVNDHPNITQIVHGHTSGGFIYRLPSASNPEEFDPTDLALIEELGAFYTDDTGRPVRPSATHPVDHRYGTFIAFGYATYGIIGWVPEYWPGPSSWVPDTDGDGEVTEADWHRANDEELGGRYFTDWTPFDHPDLGEVLIGGWHTKYWSQNPPEELLEEELQTQVPWILHLAERSPLLRVGEPALTPLGDGRYRVEVEVTNEGWLATHLTQQGAQGREADDGRVHDRLVRPILASLEGEGLRVEGGSGRQPMGHLAGANPHTDAVTERSRSVSWTVVRESPGATFRIVIASDKGGVVRTDPVELP